MVFVPENNYYNKCFVVQSEGVIRAYNKVPVNNTDYQYRDYYINSSYLYRDGIGNWTTYSALPICLDSSIITHNDLYRNDFDKICVIFLTFLLIIILLIKPIAKKFFKGGF